MPRIKSIGDVQTKVNIEVIEVPEWGGDLGVRNLSSGEVSLYHSKLMQQPKDKAPHVTSARLRHANAWLVIMGSCDDSGDPIFAEADIPELERKDNAGMSRVADAIQRLSGLGDYAQSSEVLAGKSDTSQDSHSDYD